MILTDSVVASPTEGATTIKIPVDVIPEEVEKTGTNHIKRNIRTIKSGLLGPKDNSSPLKVDKFL